MWTFGMSSPFATDLTALQIHTLRNLQSHSMPLLKRCVHCSISLESVAIITDATYMSLPSLCVLDKAAIESAHLRVVTR